MEEKEVEVVFYNKEGLEFTDELTMISNYKDGYICHSAHAEHLTCAKKEVDRVGGVERSRPYIRKCTTGPNSGHFINPYGALSNERDFTTYDKLGGRRLYEYFLVNDGVFDQYVKYLRTRNPAHLRNAERDYNNTPVEKFAHVAC